MNCIIVYSTFPSKEDAVKAARVLLEDQLAAGANILQAESLFRWQGKIEQRNEWAVFFQAERRFYQRIERRIKQLHPDTAPQIVMWRMKDGYPQFLKWIMAETVNPVLKGERKEKSARAKQAARDLKKGVDNDGNKN